MRGLPFFKPKNKPQFAGLNFSNDSSGGGGGGTSAFANKTDLTAIILTGTTNTSGRTITSGTWFYLNGTPCIAKVDIASGATFTEGTNYEKKTVGSAISELNSNFLHKTMTGLSYTAITDLNYMPSNSYTIIPGGNITNQPPNAGDIGYGDAAVILYFYCGGTYLVQLYFNTKGVSAIRTCVSGSWGNWTSL